MAESEEELKNFLMRTKEESEKASLKLSIRKTKIMISSPSTSQQTDEEKVETVTDFIFLGSKITADGNFRHEIKRCFLLRCEAMSDLDSVLKSIVMYHCESWTVKKAECQRTDAFELWCWRRLLKIPWTARRSNQSTLKGSQP